MSGGHTPIKVEKETVPKTIIFTDLRLSSFVRVLEQHENKNLDKYLNITFQATTWCIQFNNVCHEINVHLEKPHELISQSNKFHDNINFVIGTKHACRISVNTVFH